MSVQISPQIPFRPAQCPNCANYAESIQRCRAFVTESSPRPLLGIFSGESDEPCPRFEVHSQPEAFVQPPDPTLEQTVSTAQDLPGESDTVGLAQSDKSGEISADSQETSDKSQSTITDKIPPAVPVPVGLT
jgi:hypothetical protein